MRFRGQTTLRVWFRFSCAYACAAQQQPYLCLFECRVDIRLRLRLRFLCARGGVSAGSSCSVAQCLQAATDSMPQTRASHERCVWRCSHLQARERAGVRARVQRGSHKLRQLVRRIPAHIYSFQYDDHILYAYPSTAQHAISTSLVALFHGKYMLMRAHAREHSVHS